MLTKEQVKKICEILTVDYDSPLPKDHSMLIMGKELLRLREALEWYAIKQNFEPAFYHQTHIDQPLVIADQGQRARKALGLE